MKWETKDKIKKFTFICFIIGFVGVILFSYQNCQREIVKKIICSTCILDDGVDKTIEKVTSVGK